MRFYWLILPSFLLIQSSRWVYAQGTFVTIVRDDHVKEIINNLDHAIEDAYLKKDVETIMEMYTPDAAFTLEFKPAIFDSSTMRRFFKDWFQNVTVKTFAKSSISIESMNDHVLDLGTFRLTYQNKDEAEKVYAGNYLILWKRQGTNDLKIVSHTFGSDTYLESKDVPWATINVDKKEANSIIQADKHILYLVNEVNAEVIRGVRDGDGHSRANGFTEDAILMSSFEKYYVGRESLRPKMLKTYNANTSFKVTHTFQRIYDLGDYVFVNGHYSGGWGDENEGGWFEGNMSDVMKKMPDGKLKYYRQIGNRASDLKIFKR